MKVKVSLIIALILLIAGGMLCGFSIGAMHYDMSSLNVGQYAGETIPVEGDFQDILIRNSLEVVRLEPSDDGKCRVEFYSNAKETHEAYIDGEALVIKADDISNWYENIGFFAQEPSITVYLPKSRYRDLRIQTGIGSVEFSSMQFDGDIELHSTTGRVKIRDVTCGNFTSEGNTGDIDLRKVIASGNFVITRNTGSVELDDCDAGACKIETNTGDVEGTFLSDKRFVTRTVTGDIDVPKDGDGGRCEITTGSGDIEIEIR